MVQLIISTMSTIELTSTKNLYHLRYSGSPARPEPVNQRQHGFEPPRQAFDPAEQVS